MPRKHIANPFKRSRGESSSSSRGVDTMGIRFSDESHRARFLSLQGREHLVTKFAHLPTLDKLALENGVRTLLRKGGLEGFLEANAESYPRLTLEFLSTLERVDAQTLSQSTITFQLFNKPYTLTFPQIAQAFGWVYGGQIWDSPDDRVVTQFWHDLTRDVYKRDGNKVNQISHPAFRYVIRLLSMTVFLSGEPSGVSKSELSCLWAISPEGVRGIPNWVELFVRRCTEVQKAKKGKIAFGGMVTLLARAVGITNFDAAIQVQSDSSAYYDLDSLRRMSMIKYKTSALREPIYLLIKGVQSVEMPTNPRDFYDVAEDDRVADLFIYPARGQQGQRRGREESEDDGDEDDDEEEEEERDEQAPSERAARMGGDVPGTSGASGPHGDEDSWRASMMARCDTFDQRLDRLDASVNSMRDEFAGDIYDIQSQMASLFDMQMATMGYFAATGGPAFTDPREQIRLREQQRAAEREAYIASRRASRSRDPGQSSRG